MSAEARHRDSDGLPSALDVGSETFTRARIEQSYHWPVSVFSHAGPGPDAGAPQVTPLAETLPEREHHDA